MSDSQVVGVLWVLLFITLAGFGWCLWEWMRMTRLAKKLLNDKLQLQDDLEEAVRLVFFVRKINAVIGDDVWNVDGEYPLMVREWMTDADHLIEQYRETS